MSIDINELILAVGAPTAMIMASMYIISQVISRVGTSSEADSQRAKTDSQRAKTNARILDELVRRTAELKSMQDANASLQQENIRLQLLLDDCLDSKAVNGENTIEI